MFSESQLYQRKEQQLKRKKTMPATTTGFGDDLGGHQTGASFALNLENRVQSGVQTGSEK